MNESGLRPLGHCVLVEPEELEIQKGVIKLMDNTVAEAHMLQMRVRVVEVGPYCWPNEAEPRAKAGDLVMIAKMSGNLVKGPKDGKQYRAINDKDIFVRIDVEGEK